jgi:hypothetical protein
LDWTIVPCHSPHGWKGCTWMNTCLYHWHMDENVSLSMNNLLVSLVTWMKTLGLKYDSSHGWKCCPWIELLFIIWMRMLHLDIHVSNIIHHIWMQLFHLDEHFVFIIHHKDENVAFGWTLVYCHSLYGWKCCTWMNTYLDHSSIWMKILHLDEHLFRSFIIWMKMFTWMDESSRFYLQNKHLKHAPNNNLILYLRGFFSKRIIEMLKEMGFG